MYKHIFYRSRTGNLKGGTDFKSIVFTNFTKKTTNIKKLQGLDSNQRPSGHEPDELPSAPPCNKD